MSVAAFCASHSPLKDYYTPAAAVATELEACISNARVAIERYDPELVVVVGPDHFNGFFYHNLPSFCVGAEAQSVGDWKTPSGPFAVASDLALGMVEALQHDGVDPAISYAMHVDHGTTQIIDQLFDWNNLPPIIPIFVNCAAPPLPPMSRVVAFGQALGRYLHSLERRVLIIGSGGLSHDPPIPKLVDATPPVRERLVHGGTLSPAARTARQDRVLDDAKQQLAGTSEQTPLNPAWDRKFIEHLLSSDYVAIAAMRDVEITQLGGCGGHEIRSWVVASLAARAAPSRGAVLHFYHAIPEWIAGFGLLSINLPEA